MESISILIVDPSAALQKYVRNFFNERGYTADGIRAANDPQSALKIANELRPSYLLTDWFPNEPVTGKAAQTEKNACKCC
jgi:PleD family two-component response regulator